jgi:hypothetical protein
MLRTYQKYAVDKAREILKTNRSCIIQGATGSGKTPIIAAICEMITAHKNTAWIIVPRTEILKQASEHLIKWKVNHGIIAPGQNESRAYNIHVVSKDTLIRRYDKIKVHPDLIMIDECHIALDRQIEISEKFPNSKIIGMTATPERLDGRGLSELYEHLIIGPSIPWLTERNFLTPLRYFSPPIEGLENLKCRGTDYDKNDLDELLKRRKVFGEAIKHYKQHADGKPALVFCRDVKSAYETADRFCDAGYKFFCIEGKMSGKKRKQLIEALSNGKIHGLTNCEIATYGLDIPRVEVGIGLRPTLSRALYFQMIGRILRPYPGKQFGMFFDHVNNLFEHADPAFPNIPPHFLYEIEWNFYGNEKRKRVKKDPDEMSLKLCPECFLYFEGPECPNCGAKARIRKQKEIEQIDTDLIEIKSIALNDRPPEEQREYLDRIGSAYFDFKQAQKQGEINPGAVGDIIKIADELGRSIMWVYFKLTSEDRKTVNVPLLYEIARQKKYKPGWAYYKMKDLKNKMKKYDKEKKEYAESMGLL